MKFALLFLFILLKFALLFLFILLNFAYAFAEYKPGRIIIKLKAQHSSALSNTSSSELSEYLNKSIGDYSYKTLISEKLLANHRNNTSSLFAADNSIKNSLSRIYLIQFSANIDAEMLSKKLSSFDIVEYAEPDYLRSINYIPNDTLLYEQDYLVNTETYEAWAYLEDSGLLEDYLSRDILVGIVDTGIDRDHIEFEDVLYKNSGEMGTDENGNDKTSNGVDDDSNGFVDDWQGWDFVSGTSESGEDNDPSPGHAHGTHVGGVVSAINNNIAGIAGIGINMKLLPVKIGFDNQFSTSVANSYDGILYAAMAGSDIINCSWGGSNASKAEQDVIKTAMSLGSLVIAAAGNDASHRPQHPASIDGVISVAASDYTDKYASFTNYDESVDVSAPGYMVLSTVPNNGYEKWNGTSMASPVAAATAGWLKRRFSDKSPEVLGDMLKSSTRRINFLDSYRPGLMGTGVVSTFKALTDSNFHLLEIEDYSLLNQFGEDVFRFRDTISLNLSIKNKLDPLQNVTLLSYETFLEYLDILDGNSELGDFSGNETKNFANTLKFVVKEEETYDRLVTISLVFNAEDGYKEYKSLSFIINPTYLTFNRNDIRATFNSRGNIAYNDYSANTQGVGFEYKGSSSLLFEGAFMAAIPGKLADVARNSIGNSQNRSFTPQVVLNKNDETGFSEGNTSFYSESDSLTLGIDVIQHIIQPTDPSLKNVIFCSYDIVNKDSAFTDSLFAGIFMDWDIGSGGQNNQARYWDIYNAAIVENMEDKELPICAAVLLDQTDKANFYAINNPGGDSTFSIYDGFSRVEKWFALSSGIEREKSDTLDASFVLSAGPFTMKERDTVRVSFAYLAAENIDSLETTIKNAKNKYTQYLGDNVYYNRGPAEAYIQSIFPNPASDKATIDVFVKSGAENNEYSLSIYDYNGRKIADIFAGNINLSGLHRFNFIMQNFSQGTYIVQLNNNEEVLSSEILQVIR